MNGKVEKIDHWALFCASGAYEYARGALRFGGEARVSPENPAIRKVSHVDGHYHLAPSIDRQSLSFSNTIAGEA